jgi:hypothetical protein
MHRLENKTGKEVTAGNITSRMALEPTHLLYNGYWRFFSG